MTPEDWDGDERRKDDRQDSIYSLHRRFDKMETGFKDLRDEQHRMAINILAVDKRIDLVEVQIESAKAREELLYKTITDRLDSGSQVMKKLFDKFDKHTYEETEERRRGQEDQKKMLWWIIGTAVSVLTSIGIVMFGRVFS